MSQIIFVLLLFRIPFDQPAGPPPERVRAWLETHDSAPPAEWYPNGDPWRNLTAKELEELGL